MTFNSSLTRLDDLQGHPRTVLAVSVDLSERKRAEEISRRAAELNAFRVSLTDVIRPLADPVEVQATASRVLGQYLGANRVAYFELCGGDYVIERDYVNGVTTMAGGYPMESFGPKLLAAYRTGQTVSTSDVTADSNLSPDQRAAYAASQIGAYIGIPLVKGGEFVAGLAVHTAGPRTWTPDEVALAEEVAERTWAAVERARAEAALRESETKYRSLFESIDEGFCIVEMLFDAEEKPVDYRFVQANPAFVRLTGLPPDALGKTVRELVPDLEEFWVDVYGKVALTGEAVRFENKSESMNRWFDCLPSTTLAQLEHQFSPPFCCKIELQTDGIELQKKAGIDCDGSKRQLKMLYYWKGLKLNSTVAEKHHKSSNWIVEIQAEWKNFCTCEQSLKASEFRVRVLI